jgi:hypothetical protein
MSDHAMTAPPEPSSTIRALTWFCPLSQIGIPPAVHWGAPLASILWA